MTVTSTRESEVASPLADSGPTLADRLMDWSADAPLRRFTVDEYHKMIKAGILDEDEHVELLEGLIVVARVSPQGRPHAYAIQELTRFLARHLADEYRVRPQLPVTLGNRNEPEPDLAVVHVEDARSSKRHPETALIVMEVADSSLRKDRLLKAPLYARFGVPEYVIVDVDRRTFEVHREPDPAGARYRTVSTLSDKETFVSTAVSGLSFPLAPLFL
jgi:Uma2 family endonuclease